ncbi:WD40 repeat-like protein [Tilletiaria anomala UBC 951]|uniref:WD40 repeat-like protein n=1 Tax=Tilletiaria anomala (strain ATCC 24038 / CBS 436.72 / UBC 951) TaxID=1037660 RepID=A0A066VSV4_TILAU|nr:WD40 repeat-like protein [Tilletiaria anomala UBC 951]KDN41869.1 WD40 repeat-like protein [Tilletiaria anomala UBC 951]
MSSLGSGESRRRAEIEAKRAKLAELKRAREERTSRLLASRPESRAGDAGLGVGGGTAVSTPSSRKDLDDFVATLVGSSSGRASIGGASSLAGARSPAGGALGHSSPRKSAAISASSEYGGESEGVGPSVYGTTFVNRADGEAERSEYFRPPPDFVHVETELFELPPRERLYYTKEVQTTSINAFADDNLDAAGGVGSDIRIGPDGKLQGLTPAQEQLIRQNIIKEQELEEDDHEKDRRLQKEEETLEREIEEEIKTYTQEELAAIYQSSEFQKFLEASTLIAERALTDSYDYLKDYTKVGLAPGESDSERGQVHCVRTFWDEKLLKNRSITAIDWSTRHPELCVSSYNKNPLAIDEPDGLVAVWNMHLKDRPEFVFHAQTDVLSVSLSPFHPNLVIGGTYSGQILMWDTRARALPVLKTPLSASGHTHPVYSMQLVGTQNAHNLVSASTDGTVCTWMLDMLAQPQELIELQNPNHQRTPEVSVTTLSFPGQETNTFWIGTEEGNIYSAGRFDRAGSRAGLNLSEVYAGHAAPITGLHFHPLAGPIDFSDLFLSSSMDWTSRLWRANTNTRSVSRSAGGTGVGGAAAASGLQVTTPLVNFEESTDYLYDIKWHPSHPAVFGQVDGAGYFDIYDLNSDTERPIVRQQAGNGRALNKLAWDRKDGRHAAVGGADGRLYVYDIGELAAPADDAWSKMQDTVAKLLTPNAGKTAGTSPTSSGPMR